MGALVALFVGVSGCVLPPLEASADSETEDAGLVASADAEMDVEQHTDVAAVDTPRDVKSADVDAEDRGADGRAETVEFSEVSAIVTNHCLDCHGSDARNLLSLPGTPANPPSDPDLYDALVGVSSSDGAPYVKPSDPDGSVLYQRLALPADEAGAMPQGGWQVDNFESIDSTDGARQAGERATREVRIWIEQGAPRGGN